MVRPGCFAILAFSLSACGDGGGAAAPDAATCDLEALAFERGGDGHADPLGAAPGEARAGRIGGDQLPPVPGDLVTWADGDFVLANDRFALVIEDAGPSDGYDPWGGRPVGLAAVRDGALVDPADFNELLLLTGRESVVTTHVSVIADGSDGGAAIVRAEGIPAPTPFFENIVGGLLRKTHGDMPTAIDYVLEPGADAVDVYIHHNSPRSVIDENLTVLHGFMYSYRMPTWAPRIGFDTEGEELPYRAFIDDEGTSYAYVRPDGPLGEAIAQSGFSSNFGGSFVIDPCARSTRHHARLVIGGRGLDSLVQVMADERDEALREITGAVRDAGGAPAAGVRVHAADLDGGHLTRATTDDQGTFALHVPDGEAVQLWAYRAGAAIVGPVDVAADAATADLALVAGGEIQVAAVDAGTGEPLPVRIQVLPAAGGGVDLLPERFGEERPTSGRLHVAYEMDGEVTLPVPAGDWRIVVSRGYEYEIHDEVVSVAGGEAAQVGARLERVVDTTGALCADYHIHTHRSNDSADDAALKVRSLVADGLELPIRSEHEYVDDFQALIETLGLETWAYGIGSIELTTMEVYGHFGVLPLTRDPAGVNGGAPLWERYPTAADLTTPVEILSPPALFEAVRARPERPVIIVNHPRGGANYFTAAGYDPVTGMADFPDLWDEEFGLVEVFNDSSWRDNLSGNVADWFGLLNSGRRVFAVGSSDSHGIRTSPVGYPRTCLALGTDDPREVSPEMVRDATAAGHATISGGVYVDTQVADAGPGDTAAGVGATATIHVRVQAASWVDVRWLDLVIDGEVVETLEILPADANPDNPVIRFDADLSVPVADDFDGSYVIVAAYGEGDLHPVHSGREPFGVTNPIFLTR